MNREQKRQLERDIKKKRRGQKMKTYNITEKMNFEDNPNLQIEDTIVEVKADAKTVLQLVEVSEDAEDDFIATMRGYELVFSEADRKKIDKLKLNSHDFGVLINSAMRLAVGGDLDEEEEGNE